MAASVTGGIFYAGDAGARQKRDRPWTSPGNGGYHAGQQGVSMARDKIRIGCGAGFSDDRIPPGVEIVERGELDGCDSTLWGLS